MNCCCSRGLLDPVLIHMDVPDDVLVNRLTARRQCPKCLRIYNVLTQPPRVAEVCDDDGTVLTTRSDDQEACDPPTLARLRRADRGDPRVRRSFDGPHGDEFGALAGRGRQSDRNRRTGGSGSPPGRRQIARLRGTFSESAWSCLYTDPRTQLHCAGSREPVPPKFHIYRPPTAAPSLPRRDRSPALSATVSLLPLCGLYRHCGLCADADFYRRVASALPCGLSALSQAVCLVSLSSRENNVVLKPRKISEKFGLVRRIRG